MNSCCMYYIDYKINFDCLLSDVIPAESATHEKELRISIDTIIILFLHNNFLLTTFKIYLQKVESNSWVPNLYDATC